MLLWCDLESTGLHPPTGSIIEIALVATDDNLVQVGEPFVSLVQPIHLRGYEVMDGFVRDMHTKSGLLERLYNVGSLFHGENPTSCLLPNLPRLGEVERAVVEWLQKIYWLDGGRTSDREPMTKWAKAIPLAGNTVHFDKRWLAEHMDEFERMVSHRIFDVSVITEFCKRYVPEVYATRPGLGPDGKPAPTHRGLDDIMNSITTAKYYRERLGALSLPTGCKEGVAQ